MCRSVAWSSSGRRAALSVMLNIARPRLPDIYSAQAEAWAMRMARGASLDAISGSTAREVSNRIASTSASFEAKRR
ncbi:MAG: hypothetical protein ACO1O3_15335 [Sphingobium sp.]